MIPLDKAFWKGAAEGQNIFASEGTYVKLECNVSMNPWGHFEWKFSGGELPTNIVKSNNTLTVLLVTGDNFGRYNCLAINDLIGVNHTVTFGIELRTPGPPGQPINTTVEASTSVGVTLGWTCGHNGGDDNIWFVLYISDKATAEFEVYDQNIPAECSIGERNRPDYRVEGLESLTEYIFRVESLNIYGREDVSPLTAKYVTGGRYISIIHENCVIVPNNNFYIFLLIFQFLQTYP